MILKYTSNIHLYYLLKKQHLYNLYQIYFTQMRRHFLNKINNFKGTTKLKCVPKEVENGSRVSLTH